MLLNRVLTHNTKADDTQGLWKSDTLLIYLFTFSNEVLETEKIRKSIFNQLLV